MAKKYGLKELCESEGMEEMELLEAATFDSISPGICPDCGYTTEVEPDSTAGWCEECDAGTVVSALILAGII